MTVMMRALLILCVSARCAFAAPARFVSSTPVAEDEGRIPVDWAKRRVVPQQEERLPPRGETASWLCRAVAAFGPPRPMLFDDLHFDVLDTHSGARLALLVDWDYSRLELRGAPHPQRTAAVEALLDSLSSAPLPDCELLTSELSDGRVYRVHDGASSSREATNEELLALQLRRVARLDGVDEASYREWTDRRWRIDDVALNFWTTRLSAAERKAHPEAIAPLRRAARRFLARPGAIGMSALGRKASCAYLQRLTRSLPPETASDRRRWAEARAQACR